MELYVGPLHAQITIHDLKKFFKGFEKKASFRIMQLIRDGGGHYFGIVNLPTERLGIKAIKKLHTKKIEDHHVIVREYEYRASSNDRRSLDWRMKVWEKTERRIRERRQKFQVGKDVEISFDSYDSMAIKHI